MAAANAFLKRFWPRFNRRFMVKPREAGSAFVPLAGIDLNDILCVQTERTVSRDNCVSYQGKKLQIPADPTRLQYVRARVRIHHYLNDELSIFHGPRRLARYLPNGDPIETRGKAAA